MTSQEGSTGNPISNPISNPVGVFNPSTGTISLQSVVGQGMSVVQSGDGSLMVQSVEQSQSSSGPRNGSSGTEAQIMLDNFWPRVVKDIEQLTQNHFKQQELPLARIKKIMKLDDDVKVMVSRGLAQWMVNLFTNLITN